ncbi:MAG: hypothetical protein ACTSXY_15100 [Promethearchaeota archaeon]
MNTKPFNLELNQIKKIWYQAPGNTIGLTIPYKIWYNLTQEYLVTGNLTEIGAGLYTATITAPNYAENLLFIVETPPGCDPICCKSKRKCVPFKVGNATNLLFYDGTNENNPRSMIAEIRNVNDILISSTTLQHQIDWIYTISLVACTDANSYLIYVEDDKVGITMPFTSVSGGEGRVEVKAIYHDFNVNLEEDSYTIDVTSE